LLFVQKESWSSSQGKKRNASWADQAYGTRHLVCVEARQAARDFWNVFTSWLACSGCRKISADSRSA
jgi:hypothetical protein